MENITKNELRERILTLLRSQKEEERLNKSLAICNKLFELQEILEAKTILFYASFDGEVETLEMIKRAKQLGKTVCLPKTIKEKNKFYPIEVEHIDDLTIGAYGINEPKGTPEDAVSNENIDTVIVPGVAFDKKNNRLGRGEGYYDRFLSSLSERVFSVGLAFDFQVLNTLPVITGQDVPVSVVVSN